VYADLGGAGIDIGRLVEGESQSGEPS